MTATHRNFLPPTLTSSDESRHPSPSPFHLSIAGSTQRRIITDASSGYVAPKFEGKEAQMEAGKHEANIREVYSREKKLILEHSDWYN